MGERLNDLVKKEIIASYIETQSFAETARQFGVADNTVKRIVKSNVEMSAKVEQKKKENIKTVLNEMANRTEKKIAILDKLLNGIDKKASSVDAFTSVKDLATAYGILIDKDLKIAELQSMREKSDCKIMLPAEHIALPFLELNRELDGKKTLDVMLPGGRGSTKSSYWSEKIIELLENNPNWCAVVMRRVANTLNQSVKPQIEWGIEQLTKCYPNIASDWHIPKAEYDISKKSTGQKIYMRGADDPNKLKSIKPPPGKYIAIIVYEEFDQFNGMEDIRKINQTIKRGGDVFIEFDVFNTPISKQHFANKEMLIPKKDRIIVKSDYTQVPSVWLGEKFISDAEWLKENNPKAYEHEYLGVAVGEGGTVFENIELREITDEEIKTFDRIYNGVDWGWYPDPWAFNRMHLDVARRTLYIYDEDEANKKSNRQTADILINEHGITSADLITCDSAEKKSTADYRAFGLFARDAEKGPGSVEYSTKWLSTLFKIVIDPIRCPKTAKEFNDYELVKDKTGNYISVYPDKNNHHIDAVRYGTEPIWKIRGQ